MTNFAWSITKDHLHESDKEMFTDQTGTIGPSEAPDILVNALRTGKRPNVGRMVIFNIYDDDGVLYYTGQLITLADKLSDYALYAPLSDFAGPNAGATLIKYLNHPEWTMEY